MKNFILTLSLFCCALFVSAQVSIELEEFASGFSLPVDLVHDGTELLYVVEKAGVIKIINPDGSVETEPFLDIRNRVNSGGSELGLLGLAFHPDYANNGQFYVNYTDNVGLTSISRFFRDSTNALKGDPNSEDKMLRFAQPFNNHNGGDLDFGPDGYLYIASGDGGSANDPNNYAQNINSYLGKMLRIDVDTTESYRVPASNPFVGTLGLDEIWSYGLRNPWRFSFDSETGDMWIGDVGQNRLEEIDFQPADSEGGENYGWKCYEANNPYITRDCDLMQEFTFPIFEYDNNRFQAGCSVTGGYMYRGSTFPNLFGWYIYCDYCSGKFWALQATDTDTTNIEIGSFGNNEFGAFGRDVNDELYTMALRRGIVYKIKVPCSLSISTNGTDITCPGAQDGSANVMISDTNAVVTYEWSNGDTTSMISDLDEGWYTVVVRGAGCELTDSIEIMSPVLDSSCLVTQDTLIEACQEEGATLEACVAPSGYLYKWLKDGEEIVGEIDGEIMVNESGTYQVLFDGACDLDTSTSVKVVIKPRPATPVITRNQDTLFANIVAETYDWFLDDVYLGSGGDPWFVASVSGDYQVRGVTEGCRGNLSSKFNYIVSRSEDIIEQNIDIFPNPFADWIEIQNRLGLEIDIAVTDMSGKVTFARSCAESKCRVPTSQWPEGQYLVKISCVYGVTYYTMIK